MVKNMPKLVYNFDAKKVSKEIIRDIKRWFKLNGNDCNALVSLSGGKDSSIAAALCVKALGKDRVIGVLQPNGVQHDIEMSYDIANHLGIRYYEHNIQPMYDASLEIMRKNGIVPSEQTKINLAPRIRMSVIYQYSQSLHGRVINTSNLSEDWVSNFTIFGDSCGDYSPLMFLTVDEVKKVGYAIGLPKRFIEKVPEDGLVGKTDEDNLGIKYAVLDNYLRTGEIDSKADKHLIDTKYKNSQFKRNPISAYVPLPSLLYDGVTDNILNWPPCFSDIRWVSRF